MISRPQIGTSVLPAHSKEIVYQRVENSLLIFKQNIEISAMYSPDRSKETRAYLFHLKFTREKKQQNSSGTHCIISVNLSF